MTTSFSHKLTKAITTERIRQFYDLGSPLYFEVYGQHVHDGYYITGKESKQEAQENLTKIIVEKAHLKKGLKILDVGCGVGGSSVWLAEHFEASTVGITISPVQVEIARQLAKDRQVNSSFLLMDAEDMIFDDKFDVIWVLAAMTHFPHQPEFIKSATRFLKKGGKFIIFDWMLDEHVKDVLNDRYVKPVAERMLLASLYPLNSYLQWFIEDGYRIVYAEDITTDTIKTWDDALSVIKEPSVLKLAARITKKQIVEVVSFFKSIGSMKKAMQLGKIKSAIVIAEKL
jgi:tocopherol O-methyltransferase